jgi:hypothetical protein
MGQLFLAASPHHHDRSHDVMMVMNPKRLHRNDPLMMR